MRRNSPNYLFNKYDLHDSLRAQREGIKGEIDALPKDQFLNSSLDELIEYFFERHEVEPLTLLVDYTQMNEPRECKVDVSQDRNRWVSDRRRPALIDGTEVQIEVPFSGDANLLEFKPGQSYVGTRPVFDVREGKLIKTYRDPHDVDQSYIKSDLDKCLAEVQQYLKWQQVDIEQHNNALKDIISQGVQGRRDKLKKQSGLAEALGIPLKTKEGAASFNPINVKKKIVRELPPAPKGGYQAEPAIVEGDYQAALDVIRHTGASFERTPKTFIIHDEEALRDILLSNLNTQFEGEARGEAFNKAGKTDILISSEGRNAFIGECKVWRGAKGFLEAISQLLSYLTWRDCKTALIVFNKENKNFSAILEQIAPLIETHHAFVRIVEKLDENEWHIIMQAQDDETRRVQMRVMVFNIYLS